jgi:hypothetical protein
VALHGLLKLRDGHCILSLSRQGTGVQGLGLGRADLVPSGFRRREVRVEKHTNSAEIR